MKKYIFFAVLIFALAITPINATAASMPENIAQNATTAILKAEDDDVDLTDDNPTELPVKTVDDNSISSEEFDGVGLDGGNTTFDWREYIEGTIFPAAAAVIASVGTLYVLTLPLLNKTKTTFLGVVKVIRDAASLFRKTASDVDKTVKDKTDMETKILCLSEDVAYLKRHVENIEKMEHMAFENSKDLVLSGIAAEIGKVGCDDENSD